MLTEGQVLMMGGLQCPHTVTQCPVINHIFAGPGLNVSSVEECAPIAASKHHCQATVATMEGAHCHHSQDDAMYHPQQHYQHQMEHCIKCDI